MKPQTRSTTGVSGVLAEPAAYLGKLPPAVLVLKLVTCVLGVRCLSVTGVQRITNDSVWGSATQ